MTVAMAAKRGATSEGAGSGDELDTARGPSGSQTLLRGLGKALILDEDEARWRELFNRETGGKASAEALDEWLGRMRGYAADGHAFDLEENEDRIRCVAAPVRDVTGRILGAISVSGAAQYMIDERMDALAGDVKASAEAVSRDLGWKPPAGKPAARPARKVKASA